MGRISKAAGKQALDTGGRSELMPLMFRWFQYELRLYYWYQIICMVQGGGEIGNQAPHVSLPIEWFDWQGTYSALLKVPFCLAIGNRFLKWSKISWMDKFSDWKRPNPVPDHVIFPVSSSLANSPLQCSSCEIRFNKARCGRSLFTGDF